MAPSPAHARPILRLVGPGLGLGLLLSLPSGCAHQQPCEARVSSAASSEASAKSNSVQSTAAGETEEQRARQVITRIWEATLSDNPLLASDAGERAHDARLPEVSEAARRRASNKRTRQLEELRRLDLAQLSPELALDVQLLIYDLEMAAEEYQQLGHQLPLTSDSGFHTDYARLYASADLTTASGIEDYIARLEQLRAVFDGHIADMRSGLARGFTLPRVVLEGYDATIAAYTVEDAAQSGFFTALEPSLAALPEAQAAELRRRALSAVESSVLPAYREFLAFMRNEYLPGTRTTTAASDLPGGKAYYAYLIRRYTTLDTTAKDVHQTGLDEVARIRAEMQTVMRSTGFKGELSAFIQHLRQSPEFYAKTPNELLEYASRIAKLADAQLPRLFSRLPRQPYGVEPVPASIAPKYTAGRYVPAALDSTQPGRYWVNTHALETRPLYALPALTLHEAVPGHHLQIALAKELEGIAEFRRHAGYGAYVEGWALYSESLGEEMGIYRTPYEQFGRLTYEMWRACRLVIDTGLHAYGWSRAQAIDYLAAHTALSLHEVETEIDRYISWPGQALGYKMGELEIKRLRAQAERELGSRFDLRSFHDELLSGGPMPLGLLRERMQRWITRHNR